MMMTFSRYKEDNFQNLMEFKKLNIQDIVTVVAGSKERKYKISNLKKISLYMQNASMNSHSRKYLIRE